MRFVALVALWPVLAAVTQVMGAQAIDCRIEKSDYFITSGVPLRMSPDANLLMTVQGKLRNNEQVTYEKDDPVVVADVQESWPRSSEQIPNFFKWTLRVQAASAEG